MIYTGDELAEEYLTECRRHLAAIESGLLAMERAGASLDADLLSRVLDAVRLLQNDLGHLHLGKVSGLAIEMERVLSSIGARKQPPSGLEVSTLLQANDRLSECLEGFRNGDAVDTASMAAALASLSQAHAPAATPLRVLLVEDDFASRLLLQTYLARYGECHIAVNGREAVDAFKAAIEQGRGYHLVLLDIMMPIMDGREALHEMRAIEQAGGTTSTMGAKIVMTTTVNEIQEVSCCFQELCDAYLVKPIDLTQLMGHLRSYGLVR